MYTDFKEIFGNKLLIDYYSLVDISIREIQYDRSNVEEVRFQVAITFILNDINTHLYDLLSETAKRTVQIKNSSLAIDDMKEDIKILMKRYEWV